MVVLKSSRSVTYYAVGGTTTAAIFADIEKHGPSDTTLGEAIGMTAGAWSIDWKGLEVRPRLCEPDALTITLSLVVTLPQHRQVEALPPDIRANWERFAERVAAHEQRHVDIYLDGARAMKQRMEAALTTGSPCEEIEQRLRAVWILQQAETERRQSQFHAEDEARVRRDRSHLQAEIDANQRRLADLDSDIRRLEEAVTGLRRQHEASDEHIDAVKAELARIGASPAACGQAPAARAELSALCQRHRGLVAARRALVDQHDVAVERRNALATEHNRLVDVTGRLVETLYWTR
jgi:predicted secreted Zn-dependent protease